MNQRVALITGSTSGIGLGIAKAFAKEKYSVVINGIIDDGAALARALETEFGTPVLFSDANLMTEAGCAKLVSDAQAAFGKIDVLVNNAGMQHVAPIEEFTTEAWNRVIALNLTAAFLTTKNVFAGMKARGFGRVINMSSVHGLVASEFKAAYVASKHGLLGLTKVTALEGAPFGVTCNAICPGYVKTPLVEGQIRDQAKAHGISEDEVVKKVMLAKHAMKEFISVDAIADTCLMLAGETGRAITGTTLTLDGGWTAQ